MKICETNVGMNEQFEPVNFEKGKQVCKATAVRYAYFFIAGIAENRDCNGCQRRKNKSCRGQLLTAPDLSKNACTSFQNAETLFQ